jgi:hypothetical protein
MATPLYTLRLPAETITAISELGRIYGAPNGRAFVRDMIVAMTSGDIEKVKAFNGQLMRGIGEQMTLQLSGAVDAVLTTQEPTKTAKTPAKKGKTPSRKPTTRKTRGRRN